MDDFYKTQFHPRSANDHSLPRVSRERAIARAAAADRYKSGIPPSLRRCECCGWQPPAPLLARNTRLSLLDAHHVIPVRRGGTDDENNLILLCPNCHAIADYLGGLAAGIGPLKTRNALLEHLVLLTTNPEAWEREQQERDWQRQKRSSALLENLLDG